MTDRELLIRIDDLLNKKASWSGNPNFNDKKAYVTFLIRDYVDIVTDLSNQLKQSICDRCGKVSPAEIHTCTPAYVDRRQWLYDPMTGEPLINGWPLYSGLPQPEQCTRCGKVNPAEIHTCTPKQPDVPEIAFGNMEPVAWLDSLDRSQPHAVTGFQYLSVAQIERGEQHKYIPVYAAPLRESGCGECGKKQSEGYALYCVECSKPMREWIGLTDEEINAISLVNGFRKGSIRFRQVISAVEAKLKEKNT